MREVRLRLKAHTGIRTCIFRGGGRTTPPLNPYFQDKRCSEWPRLFSRCRTGTSSGRGRGDSSSLSEPSEHQQSLSQPEQTHATIADHRADVALCCLNLAWQKSHYRRASPACILEEGRRGGGDSALASRSCLCHADPILHPRREIPTPPRVRRQPRSWRFLGARDIGMFRALAEASSRCPSSDGNLVRMTLRVARLGELGSRCGVASTDVSGTQRGHIATNRATKNPPERAFSKRMMGLEPTTFCMASRRSSQLSYIRVIARV